MIIQWVPRSSIDYFGLISIRIFALFPTNSITMGYVFVRKGQFQGLFSDISWILEYLRVHPQVAVFLCFKQKTIKCNWVQNIESSTKTILNNISKSMFIFLNPSSFYCWLLPLRGSILYDRLNHFQITWFLWFLRSQPSPVPTNTHPIFHPYFYYFSPQTRDFRIFHSTEKVAILLHFALSR